MPESNSSDPFRATAQQLQTYLQTQELVHPQGPYGGLLVARLAVRRSGVLAPGYVNEVTKLSRDCLSDTPPLPLFRGAPAEVVNLLHNVALETWGMNAFGERFARELTAALPGK